MSWCKYVRLGSSWVNFFFQIPLFILLFPGLDFIGCFICINTDLLVVISLDKIEGFSAELEEDVI